MRPRVAGAVALAGWLAIQPDAHAAISRPGQTAPAKGRVLVARDTLGDPNFAESVVLLLAHGEAGAMGIVLNKPTSTRAADVRPDVKELGRRKDVVHVGGPVLPERLMLLLRTPKPPPDAVQIVGDLYVGGADALRVMVKRKVAAERLRIFAGHAGWAPGQLEAEIARDDWCVLRVDGAVVFETPAERLWPDLSRRCTAEWATRPVERARRNPEVTPDQRREVIASRPASMPQSRSGIDDATRIAVACGHGNATTGSPRSRPATMRSAAAPTSIRNGICPRRFCVIGVSTKPGRTSTTCTPVAASSMRIASRNVLTAALLAE